MKYLYYLLLMLAIFSCKKESGNYTNNSNISETLKNNYSFEEGSYWIYKDFSSNVDSIYVSEVNTGFTPSCQDCKKKEFIKTTYYSDFHYKFFNHYLQDDFIRYNGGGEYGENGQPIFILNKPDGYKFNGLIVDGTFDSVMLMDSSTFYNVHRMKVIAADQYQKEFEYDTDFYFVPSIGIIQYSIHDTVLGTVVWNLVDYKIKN